MLFGKTLAKLEPFERKIWHTNMVTFFPTFAVTYFAAPAIWSTPVCDTASCTRTHDTLKGCGMSLGYMFWDLMVLITDPVGQMKAYGGLSPYVLFSSITPSPSPRGPRRLRRPMRLFRQLLPRLGGDQRQHDPPLVPNEDGPGGQPSVFLERHLWIPSSSPCVAVIPNLVDQYWNSDWSALGPVETWAARLLLPIPVGLNVYWFGLIVSTAVKYILTGSEDGAPAKAGHKESKKKK